MLALHFLKVLFGTNLVTNISTKASKSTLVHIRCRKLKAKNINFVGLILIIQLNCSAVNKNNHSKSFHQSINNYSIERLHLISTNLENFLYKMLQRVVGLNFFGIKYIYTNEAFLKYYILELIYLSIETIRKVIVKFQQQISIGVQIKEIFQQRNNPLYRDFTIDWLKSLHIILLADILALRKGLTN